LDKGNVIHEDYPGGKNGTAVTFYTVKDGSHKWPGVGRSGASDAIDTTKTMWAFFKAHPRK